MSDEVDEQNMRDLERDLFLGLGRHVPMRVASTPKAIIHVLRCPVEQKKIERPILAEGSGYASRDGQPGVPTSLASYLTKLEER